VNFVGEGGVHVGAEAGAGILARRAPRSDLAADPNLPDDTRLWAALQDASGGAWGGCVFDVDAILKVLAAGRKALE
jgi:xylonate dehydratase